MNAKRVLIIGATTGLGKGLASVYSRAGCSVIGTYRSEQVNIEENGLDCQFIRLDMACETDIENVCCSLETSFDLVIVAAAKMSSDADKPHEEFGNLEMDQFTDFMSVNCFAPIKLVQQMIARDRLARDAKIVVLSSALATKETVNGAYWYKLSKAALNRAVLALASDLKPHNVSIYAMHPGLVITERIEHRRARLVQSSGEPALEVTQAVAAITHTIELLTENQSGHFVDNQGKTTLW